MQAFQLITGNDERLRLGRCMNAHKFKLADHRSAIIRDGRANPRDYGIHPNEALAS
ncbi:MAG: hypothetical protein R2788_18575 [Saprospiraceae bacterium]